MIENLKVKDRKSLVNFIITSISDGDFRTKIQEIPDLLDNNNFNVDDFISRLEATEDDNLSTEIQNSSMLFIELMLKGRLVVSKEQLDRLSKLL